MLSFSQAEEINARSDPEEREKKIATALGKKKKKRDTGGEVFIFIT